MAKRSSLRTARVAAVLGLVAGWTGGVSAQSDQSTDVVVISGQYPGSAAPVMDDLNWADYYSRKVGAFYASSSGFHNGTAAVGRSLFNFRPASSFGGLAFHSFSFDWRDYGSSDQSELENIITREGLDAVRGFDESHPGQIDLGLRNFLVMANLPNRGRASPFTPYVTKLGNLVILGVTVFDEPAGARVQGGELVTGDASDPRVNLRTAATCAHELGHLLALPDLYAEDADDEFVGDWCVMARGDFVHFSGWSRAVKGWTPPGLIAVPPRPAPGATAVSTFRIFPPMTPLATNHTEIVMIPADESLASFSPTLASFLSLVGVTRPGSMGFYGYVLEVRGHTGADATSTSLPVDGTPIETAPRTGQPATATDGVLISYAQPGFTARHRPFNPLEVRRLPAGERLREAPFVVGETFTDTARGVTVAVTGRNPDGSFVVRVTWTVPPRPALTARDAWIDSPGNGLGTFFFGGGAGNANPPPLSGDLVFVPTTVEWRQGLFDIPYPVFVLTPTPHRVQFRLRNSGRIAIGSLSGKVAILEPQLIPPLGALGNDPLAALLNLLDALNPVTLIDFGAGDVGLVGDNGNGVLDPGEEANVTVGFAPKAPFMAVILVDRVLSVATATTAAQPEPTEGLLDNWLAEPFVVLTTSPGSPYEPRTFEFPVRNVDARRRFVTMAFDGLPTSLDPQVAGRNWRLKLDPPFASLGEGQSERFALTIQPPDPPEYKGGIQTVGALGFMNHLDAVIPMDRLDVHVVAAARSMLTVSMDAKGSLEGQLTYRTLSGAVANAPAGLPIHLTVSGSDGVNLTYVPGEAGHGALTQAGGRYQQAAPASFQPRGGVRYQVVAEWMGNPELAPARAEALYESPKSERGADLVPSAIRLADLARRRVSVRVRNAGDAPIRGARLALFWSKDEHASPDDRPTGEAPIPALKPGRGADVRVALPPASAGGPYLIAVCVPARPSDERNLLNNALAQALAR